MIATRVFGRHEGREVVEAVLESGPARVAILNYGCVVRDWRLGGRLGGAPMVLGFERFEDYPLHSRSFGIVAGRVANRIARGRFTLDGQEYRLATNNGANHLHGGAIGLGRRVWTLETDTAANAVRLVYDSPDGEEGYPGRVRFTVTFRLDGTRLSCEMRGVPDRRTPINLAQHSYYNIGDGQDVLDHRLAIDAEGYTPVDAGLIPTGEILPVAGTRFDFTRPRRIAEADADGAGHDHNFVLRAGRDRTRPAAEVRAEIAGGARVLRLWTDRPGLQLYTARPLAVPVPGLDGRRYGSCAGLCLEAQHFPDALNRPAWPSIVRSPEYPYRQWLAVDISLTA
jgi:aldose 1-epimerase